MLQILFLFSESSSKGDPKKLASTDVKVGMWVRVIFEDEWYLGKVMEKNGAICNVRCLEKPFGIKEPQDMEHEKYTMPYDTVYEADGINPSQIAVGRCWKWVY